AGRRNLRGELNGFVQAFRLDQVKTAQLLLRFGEGTVGYRSLAAADPYGFRSLDGLKSLGGNVASALPDPLAEGKAFRILGLVGRGGEGLFVEVDQAKILHGLLRMILEGRCPQMVVGIAPQSTASRPPSATNGRTVRPDPRFYTHCEGEIHLSGGGPLIAGGRSGLPA